MKDLQLSRDVKREPKKSHKKVGFLLQDGRLQLRPSD